MTLRDDLLQQIDNHGGIVYGTEYVALELLGCPHKKHYVIDCLQQLAAAGLITIIPPRKYGRGHKTSYMLKRNRNSPGQPRKR
jgi:hypothetical protein